MIASTTAILKISATFIAYNTALQHTYVMSRHEGHNSVQRANGGNV